ncbi:MAG: right-handed parallel beta-helix repeat-containing protein [Planctomycetota bacterium]
MNAVRLAAVGCPGMEDLGMCRVIVARILLISLAGVLLATVSAHAQTTWYVDDVTDPAEDGSIDHPFDAIQEGIDAASNGDTVSVLDGTYTGAGNRGLDFGGKSITVSSENGSASCTIDCQDNGRGFYFHSGETGNSVVDGFTIQNGEVDWNSPGGGRGGGIYCYSSSPTIKACTIRWNQVDADGGGVYCDWGAMPTIADCSVTGNQAASYGGGVCCYNGSDVTMADCTISENTGIAGSGLASFASNPTVTNCSFTDNAASGST